MYKNKMGGGASRDQYGMLQYSPESLSWSLSPEVMLDIYNMDVDDSGNMDWKELTETVMHEEIQVHSVTLISGNKKEKALTLSHPQPYHRKTIKEVSRRVINDITERRHYDYTVTFHILLSAAENPTTFYLFRVRRVHNFSTHTDMYLSDLAVVFDGQTQKPLFKNQDMLTDYLASIYYHTQHEGTRVSKFKKPVEWGPNRRNDVWGGLAGGGNVETYVP